MACINEIPRQINITDMLHIKNTKPSYVKTNTYKNIYFCPYCNEVREFKRDKYLGVKKCIACGISDRDFYVKVCNRLGG